jgi:hypothetical protein
MGQYHKVYNIDKKVIDQRARHKQRFKTSRANRA